MIAFHEEYIVDERGKKKSVVIPVEEWEQILEAVEELEDIRAFDEAKNHPSEPMSFELAIQEIEEGESS